MKKKSILVVAILMMVCMAVGGTLAWLVAEDESVVNTFTPATISIELTETEPDGKTAKMVPGNTIKKDPSVTVETGSEECWLFVKVEAANGADTYLDYDVAEGWTAVTGHDGYYWREVTTTSIGTAFPILKDNQVKVSGTVTAADMTAIAAKNPTLTFKAAAVQKANITSATNAWKALPQAFSGEVPSDPTT